MLEEEPCYVGQWRIHPPHVYEVQGAGVNFAKGIYEVQCPGKTEQTVLGYRPFETVRMSLEEIQAECPPIPRKNRSRR